MFSITFGFQRIGDRNIAHCNGVLGFYLVSDLLINYQTLEGLRNRFLGIDTKTDGYKMGKKIIFINLGKLLSSGFRNISLHCWNCLFFACK